MSGSHAYYVGDPPGLAGAHHYGVGGLGVLGSEIPSSGEHGPGYLYPSLNLPADANKEYYGVLGAIPAGLSPFDVDEYSRVTAAANNGSYRVPFTLYENGTSLGATYFDMNFGVVGAVVNLTAASCTQSNASGTAATSIIQGAKTVNLVGGGSTQAALSSSGAVGVVPPGGPVLDLSRVSLSRIVVFEGSGSRIVIF